MSAKTDSRVLHFGYETWHEWDGQRLQKAVLTFVRWETVAVRNFRSDVVLQSFEMVLELLG
jgi:hypothetical protein